MSVNVFLSGSRMLRTTALLLRLLVTAIVAGLLVSWNLDWLPQPDHLPPAAVSGSRSQQGRQVYASEELQSSTFTLNGSNYRWSTLHTNVLQEGDERYMEILAFLEDIDYNGPMSIHHQAIVPSNITEIIDKITCNFHSGAIQTTASIRYDMPHAWYAVLVRCAIPPEATLPAKAIIELSLRRKDNHIKHSVELAPYRIDESNQTSNLAICLAPAFGKLDLFKILEWRLHHARLGVKSVHWYTRGPNDRLRTLVNILNNKEELLDTWKEAIPISPNTFQTEHLQEHGLYGDQVLYYIDCLERSKHLHPSPWLAFIDLDEYFLPEAFDLSGLDNFLDLEIHSDLATICFDRNQVDKFQDHGQLLFEHITDLVERKEDHPTDNRKCIHRPGSLLVPFVHWPLLLREGKASKEVVYNTEGINLRLIHASSKEYWGARVSFNRTGSFQRHVHLLRTDINYYLRVHSNIFH